MRLTYYNCTYLEVSPIFMCMKIILRNEYAAHLRFTMEPLISLRVPPKFCGTQFGKTMFQQAKKKHGVNFIILYKDCITVTISHTAPSAVYTVTGYRLGDQVVRG
jgi:hypothetical protein